MPDPGADPPRWRIAVVEDHLLQRMLTRHVIDSDAQMRVVFAGETLPEFSHWWEGLSAEGRPDLLLLDLMVDHGESADPAIVARLVGEGLHVGIFSALGSPALARQMIQAGASGVIGKRESVEDILSAIRSMVTGGEWLNVETAALIAQDPVRPRLSEQEERTLVLYTSGLTLDAVATAIGVRRGTAERYLKRVKEKYQSVGRPARTKIELRTAALRDGLLESRETMTG